MAVGELVTLVNRTSQPLTVTRNGVVRVLQPGRNPITHEWVRFAKLQNPRQGTFTPGSLEGDYLVGVEGIDDCDMIEPGKEHPGVERFDRSGDLAAGSTVEYLRTGERPPQRLSDPVPAEAKFEGRDR